MSPQHPKKVEGRREESTVVVTPGLAFFCLFVVVWRWKLSHHKTEKRKKGRMEMPETGVRNGESTGKAKKKKRRGREVLLCFSIRTQAGEAAQVDTSGMPSRSVVTFLIAHAHAVTQRTFPPQSSYKDTHIHAHTRGREQESSLFPSPFFPAFSGCPPLHSSRLCVLLRLSPARRVPAGCESWCADAGVRDTLLSVVLSKETNNGETTRETD